MFFCAMMLVLDTPSPFICHHTPAHRRLEESTLLTAAFFRHCCTSSFGYALFLDVFSPTRPYLYVRFSSLHLSFPEYDLVEALPCIAAKGAKVGRGVV